MCFISSILMCKFVFRCNIIFRLYLIDYSVCFSFEQRCGRSDSVTRCRNLHELDVAEIFKFTNARNIRVDESS